MLLCKGRDPPTLLHFGLSFTFGDWHARSLDPTAKLQSRRAAGPSILEKLGFHKQKPQPPYGGISLASGLGAAQRARLSPVIPPWKGLKDAKQLGHGRLSSFCNGPPLKSQSSKDGYPTVVQRKRGTTMNIQLSASK